MINEKTKPNYRVTLRDIAKDTGFSVNTISHALKNKDDISEQTRQLIQKRAEEMGYIADAVAGSLRSGSTRTIAVILGDMSNPLFGLWVREIETSVFKQGYSTLIMNTDEDEKVEHNAVLTAISKRVDGIIICPTQKQSESIGLLQNSSIPYVLIGRRYDDSDMDYVVQDDVQGGYIATRHLLDKGKDRVLFLNGPSHISSSRERLQGYYNAHKDAGQPVDPALLLTVGIKSGEYSKMLRQIIDQGVIFNAILAFSDIVALEVLNELYQLGSDYSSIPLASFDDIMQGLILPIPLDSVASAEGSPSVLAADLLIQRMREKNRHEKNLPKQIVLKVKLVHRNFFDEKEVDLR